MMTFESSRGAPALKVRERPLEEIVRPDAMGLIRRSPVHPLPAEVDS